MSSISERIGGRCQSWLASFLASIVSRVVFGWSIGIAAESWNEALVNDTIVNDTMRRDAD